ncbi:MAG: hypothetical protein JO211_14425 [Acidobacteriaceae bacterium]|nr:hypothetical protein [Acidobacteriaceae bacterium]
MTAAEAYELTTKGGATDFGRVVAVCESFGAYCLIGGLAINCYVEPVYTLDADLVVVARFLPAVVSQLEMRGFHVESHRNSVNAQSRESDLRIQFTTDERYQSFPSRAEIHDVLGVSVKVASMDDLVSGKLWSYGDQARRLSKRKKDELDLIRLAEAYPDLAGRYPKELLEQLKRK